MLHIFIFQYAFYEHAVVWQLSCILNKHRSIQFQVFEKKTQTETETRHNKQYFILSNQA